MATPENKAFYEQKNPQQTTIEALPQAELRIIPDFDAEAFEDRLMMHVYQDEDAVRLTRMVEALDLDIVPFLESLVANSEDFDELQLAIIAVPVVLERAVKGKVFADSDLDRVRDVFGSLIAHPDSEVREDALKGYADYMGKMKDEDETTHARVGWLADQAVAVSEEHPAARPDPLDRRTTLDDIMSKVRTKHTTQRQYRYGPNGIIGVY